MRTSRPPAGSALHDSASGVDEDLVHFRLDGVVKSFGSTSAVQGLTLEVARGEFICLLGPSGCGKSTLLNIIAGVFAPDAGRVYLSRRDVTTVPIQRRNIGVVFQSYALFPNMNVEENVGFGLRARGVERNAVATEVDRMLRLVGLEGRKLHRPVQLSGGEQQRVALARALAISPSLLLLDEPFSNLDAALRTELRAETRRIQRETNVTTIMVTHDQAEAFEMADRIALMRHGEFIQIGTPQELYSLPKTEFAARFVGEANVFRAPVADVGGRYVINFAGNAIPLPSRPESSSEATFVVRPERVSVTLGNIQATGDAGGSDLPIVEVSGRVREAAYRGSGFRYVIELDGGHGTLVVWKLSDRQTHYDVGDQVTASWRTDDALVLTGADGV